uniref:Dynamin_M domain-containing protein n=1 Tax=Macrostomum lignano TaxID=282301 RepID=A0A1I8JSB9_9PLAT
MTGNSGMEHLIFVINSAFRMHAHHLERLIRIDRPQIARRWQSRVQESSVLENFVGRDFLRREGLESSTRRPLILQLMNYQNRLIPAALAQIGVIFIIHFDAFSHQTRPHGRRHIDARDVTRESVPASSCEASVGVVNRSQKRRRRSEGHQLGDSGHIRDTPANAAGRPCRVASTELEAEHRAFGGLDPERIPTLKAKIMATTGFIHCLTWHLKRWWFAKQIGPRLKEPTLRWRRAGDSKSWAQWCNKCAHEMRSYPRLRETVEGIVSARIREREVEAKSQLMLTMDIQLGYINTNHEDFIGFVNAQKSTERRTKERVGN